MDYSNGILRLYSTFDFPLCALCQSPFVDFILSSANFFLFLHCIGGRRLIAATCSVQFWLWWSFSSRSFKSSDIRISAYAKFNMMEFRNRLVIIIWSLIDHKFVFIYQKWIRNDWVRHKKHDSQLGYCEILQFRKTHSNPVYILSFELEKNIEEIQLHHKNLQGKIVRESPSSDEMFQFHMWKSNCWETKCIYRELWARTTKLWRHSY